MEGVSRWSVGRCRLGLGLCLAPLLALSDLFDFSIYVDARVDDIRQWYIDRFFALRRTVFTDERSYFHPYAEVDEDEAAGQAEREAELEEP